MRLTDQIKSCGTVQEALLLLAAAIDELQQPAADPFQQPLEWATPALPPLKAEAGDRRTSITSDGETGEVVVPAVSEEREGERIEWAERVKLWEYLPLDEDTTVDAFAAGGPQWLYYGSRDAVMQLPYPARQWLVAEIAQDSPTEAKEVGRDILKSMDSVPMAQAVESIQRMSDARG